jgi:hypothetical protein
VVSLVTPTAALANFNVQKLRVGSSSGTEDYLYTTGQTVVEQGKVDSARYYRFDVSDPSGGTRFTSSCRPSPSNNVARGSYALQPGDPLSNATAWRFRLREFGTASDCNSASSAQHDGSLYFDVSAASTYTSSALTTKASYFKSGAAAYVQVAGAGKVKTSASNTAQSVGSWSTSWLLPSGATACANTKNNANDLPGSTAGGQLPDHTSAPVPALPNLQYRPSLTTSFDAWNLEANYETRPCQDFASGNQGQWSLSLSRDPTHFVTLPVFTVDTTPPDTTLTGGPSGVTASTSAAFTFTSPEAGATFQCSLDGAPPTACSSPKPYTGLADGPHAFSVQAVDAAGNADPTPATLAWTVDTSSPNVTLTTPAAGAYTNSSTPTLSGTGETASGDSAVTVKVYSGTSTTGTPLQTLSANVQPDGTWTANASALAEGTYTAQAQQTDAVNNTGYSEQHTFKIDTTPPTVTLSAPTSGTHTNDTTPGISGTAGTAEGDLPTVTVTITGGTTPLQLNAPVSPTGSWEAVLPQALTDGNYTLQATQGDKAGNVGSSFSSALTIDTTPPQTFLDAGPVGTTSSTTATFAFHSTDALSHTGTTFQCQLDGGSWGACSSPKSYFNLANGSHTFSVQAIDGADNLDTTGQTATWTVNTVLPAITLDSPANGSSTNDATPAFSGTAGTAAGDASTVQVLVYSNTDLSGSPVQALQATRASDGSWSATAAHLADGVYVAYAQQAGAAGTATSDAHTFTVDTQAPQTTITLAPPGQSGTGVSSFSFTSSDPGSTFECQLDGGGWSPCTSPQYYSGLGNGSHTFQVRATDAAGNVGAAASHTWTVNTSLPAVTLSSPGDGTKTNNRTPTIAGAGGRASGDSSTVTVNLYSGTSIDGTALQTITTTVSSVSGAWSTHPSPLADGTYTVYAQQDGSAGTAYTSASTFTVDTAPPTTSITSGPQGNTSASSARFTFTSSEAGSTFQCQLDSGAWTTCTSPQSYGSLAVGSHTFSVRATDAAGNVDPNPPVANWTIDTTALVTLTAPADGAVTNNPTPMFMGAADPSGGSVSVEIDDNLGNPVETLSASAASSWSATAAPALAEGSYTAFAYQLSSDGITTNYSSVISFTIDRTPPAVTLTSGPAGPTNDATPSFGGQAGTAPGDAPNVTLKIYVGTTPSGTPVQTLAVPVSAGTWSAAAAALPDGTYTARAEQSDAVGNTGYSFKRAFTVDTAAPDTSITNGPPVSTADTSAAFSFTSSENGSTFECRLDGGTWTACSTPNAYNGLTVGAHTFDVRATDAAGNVDPTPATLAWNVTAPPQPGNNSGGNTPPGANTPPAAKLTLKLSAKARQHLARRRLLTVQARCTRPCSLLLRGTLTVVAKGKRTARNKRRTLAIPRLLVTKLAGSRGVRLTLKLSPKARKAVAAALARKLRVTLQLSGLATAPRLRSASARVTIQLLR